MSYRYFIFYVADSLSVYVVSGDLWCTSTSGLLVFSAASRFVTGSRLFAIATLGGVAVGSRYCSLGFTLARA